MTIQTADFPVREALVDKATLLVRLPWIIWFRDLRADVNTNSSVIGTITLNDQNAAIGTTPFDLPSLSGGSYQVNAVSQITGPAGVSSSVTVQISFTLNGQACLLAGKALTSNDPTKPVGDVIPIAIDAGTPISYSTLYAANPASSAAYSLILTVVRVSA